MLLLFSSLSAMAGDYYYESHINTYDAQTGLYYKSIEESGTSDGALSSKTAQHHVVNINIFNPTDETSTLLFKSAQKDGIPVILFESDIKDGAVEFSGTASKNIILNNIRIERKSIKNKLLVGTRNKDAKETTLFTADKKGNNLKKLVTIPYNADWHLDVKNSKIRVMTQTTKGLNIESYDW